MSLRHSVHFHRGATRGAPHLQQSYRVAEIHQVFYGTGAADLLPPAAKPSASGGITARHSLFACAGLASSDATTSSLVVSKNLCIQIVGVGQSSTK